MLPFFSESVSGDLGLSPVKGRLTMLVVEDVDGELLKDSLRVSTYHFTTSRVPSCRHEGLCRRVVFLMTHPDMNRLRWVTISGFDYL